MKTYFDYMSELSPDDIYEGLLCYGMFSDKIPPCFTSKSFYEYCVSKKGNFENREYKYVIYNSIRNINIPRQLGIPSPMAYDNLCRCISNNWGNLLKYFESYTNNESYKTSRIHIRKIKNDGRIFEMSYDNWIDDGDVEPSICKGAKYIVRADISNCFPSIYSHSIPWALVGKKKAKQDKTDKNLWTNEIDKYVRFVKDNETHGLLIGPHVSNIVSEIILTKIDSKLRMKWDYIRNIDDYTAYVKSEIEASQFLMELQRELSEFDLNLNHKKTKMTKLPKPFTTQWVRKISMLSLNHGDDKIDYRMLKNYLDNVIDIVNEEDDNAAVLKYALKVLNSAKLTDNALMLKQRIFFPLGLIYPYLIPLFETYIFESCNTEFIEISEYANLVYDEYSNSGVCEPIIYTVYWAIKYKFKLHNINISYLIGSKDTVLLTLGYYYYKKNNMKTEKSELKKYAKELLKEKEDFECNWLFVYEALSENDGLFDGWQELKKNGIKFVKF